MRNSFNIPAPTPPRGVPRSLFNEFDVEIDALLNVPMARSQFKVDGSGLAAAVLDTGLRVTHRCFIGRVLEGRNFTEQGGCDDVTDRNGHGTNVAGIIAAGTDDERRGIAPGAKIAPLKVLPASGFKPILDALSWVRDNAQRFDISVANLSLGVPGINATDDAQARREFPELDQILAELAANRVAVVVAAGNDYHRFQVEGMSVPAIFRQVISVSAVFDSSAGRRQYADGAIAFRTHADQMTPFAQRLSPETSPECFTDVLSAGASATSAGAADDDATSIQDGTSQAAPTVCGIVLLLQQHYRRRVGKLPPVALLQEILRSTSTWILDDDPRNDEDNVTNTGKRFPRVDAFRSLVALDRALKLGLAE